MSEIRKSLSGLFPSRQHRQKHKHEFVSVCFIRMLINDVV